MKILGESCQALGALGDEFSVTVLMVWGW